MLDGQLAVALDDVDKTRLFVILAAEDFHHALAGDAFVEHGRQLAHGLLRTLAQMAHAAARQGHDDGHDGHRRHAEQGQFHVDAEQQDQIADGGDGIAHHHVEHVQACLRHLAGVEGHARLRQTGGGGIEEAAGQAHDGGEHFFAQIGLHAAR
ncbi:hypothetical protein D3C72_1591890 [compost metagenome]